MSETERFQIDIYYLWGRKYEETKIDTWRCIRNEQKKREQNGFFFHMHLVSGVGWLVGVLFYLNLLATLI